MKPKDLKLKMIDLSEEMLETVEGLELIEDKMKVISFTLIFWQEQAEHLINYSKANGEIKRLAKLGLDKQKALLREKFKSE